MDLRSELRETSLDENLDQVLQGLENRGQMDVDDAAAFARAEVTYEDPLKSNSAEPVASSTALPAP